MLFARITTTKCKLCSLLLLGFMPVMTGCDPITLAASTFGAGLWLDIFLTPIRSLLGTFALNFVNTL